MSRPHRRGGPARRPRPRKSRGHSRVGERFTAEVGPIAHGGHCVTRVPTGSPEGAERVVFTRHALPGELVELVITEGTDGDRFWRADAVEVLRPSPDRVSAPCPFAGPGRCGGCDFQHATLPAQRDLKAAVLAEQLARLAGLEIEVDVEPVSHSGIDPDRGLRWRTRQRYVDLGDGRRGMRKHRSAEVIEVDDCLIAAPDAREPAPETVTERVRAGDATHPFTRAGDGFWQVHPAAPRVLVEAVLQMLQPRPGESVLDLYAGVGLFSGFLADRVGEEATVTAVEGSPSATRHAAGNLAHLPGARVLTGDVAAVLAGSQAPGSADLVVLDPPREGARRPVVEQVVARSPRAAAYVACDPAALARDVAIFAEHGYRVARLRAFDLFPMTHHLEAVALLERT